MGCTWNSATDPGHHLHVLQLHALGELAEAANQPKPAVVAEAARPADRPPRRRRPQPTAPLVSPPARGGAVRCPAPTTGETFAVTTDLVTATFLHSRAVTWSVWNCSSNTRTATRDKHFVLFEAKHQYLGPEWPDRRRPAQSSDSLQAGRLAPANWPRAPKNPRSVEGSGPEGVKVAKVSTFHRGSYVVDVAWEIENGSGKPLASHAYFQLQRDHVAPLRGDQDGVHLTGPAVYTEAEKYQKVDFGDAIAGKAVCQDRRQRLAGHGPALLRLRLIPADKSPREFYMRADGVENGPGRRDRPSGGSGSRRQGAVLRSPCSPVPRSRIPSRRSLPDSIWWSITAGSRWWPRPSSGLWKRSINWWATGGWAIVILTVLIKAAFYPLSAASYKSMAKMRVLTPAWRS